MEVDLSCVVAHTPRAVTDEEREAAVLVPVVDAVDPSLVFIKRADDLGQHAGQMGFPGGGAEPVDSDLAATAIREAGEEIGMRAHEVDLVGRLDDIRTVTRYSVRPFVARVPDREYEPDYREVVEVAVLSLADLTAPENYHAERRDHPYYGDTRLHYFHVDGYTVWGATGRMLVQFLELTTGWEMPPEAPRVDPDAEYPV
jgi:8-oxo-dGTP pyrophosphatase MutT (NUDIX family)